MNITNVSEWLRLTDEARRALLAGPDQAKWIEALARYGFAEAQTLYGQMLLDAGPDSSPGSAPGSAPGSSPGSAFGWFSAAAEADHAPGINMMGRCLEHGWHVAVDKAAAAACYRRAAAAAYDWGQYNLGCVLLYGIGTARDRVGSYVWLERAAGQGLAKAMNLLGRFHEEGWDRDASRQVAAAWYRQAAEGGDYRGMFNYAALLHRQNRVGEAVSYLRAAIDVGNPSFLADVAQHLSGNDDPLFRAIGAEAAQRRALMSPVARSRSDRPAA